MSETNGMSTIELCEKALKLAEERTNGSQPALYLLVERMRPMLVALVGAWQEHAHQVDDLRVRVDGIAEAVARVTAERDEWKRRAQAHGCDVERGDADCG